MYKPIAQNDKPMICALLNYYKKLYKIIGTIVLILGTVLVPVVPYFMKGGAPEGLNVYLLYYLYLINSVISYFFAGYRQSLLTAHQRTDITNKISTFVSIFIQLFQIIALYLTRSMYVYAVVPILGTVLTNILNYFVTSKKYPDIFCKGKIPNEIVIDINDECITMTLTDKGPGIEDIEAALSEGYSTAGPRAKSLGFGEGMGFSSMKKYSDDMEIYSEPGVGTTLIMKVFVRDEE